MSTATINVGVFFGGPSVEHEVSVITGLEAMHSLDPSRYTITPVYVDEQRRFWTGTPLTDRKNYPISEQTRKNLTQLTVPVGRAVTPGKLTMIAGSAGLFSGEKTIVIDVVLPTFHGTYGEDGAFSGLLEWLDVPFASCGSLAAATFMSKAATKRICESLHIPVVPWQQLHKPADVTFAALEQLAESIILPLPLCVKPNNLGSSVEIHKVEERPQLVSALQSVFRFDDSAMVEQFVPHLIEYNIAVTGAFGDVRTSSIERPVRKSDVLDFKAKYLGTGDKATKLQFGREGMAGAARILDPEDLSPANAQKMQEWAKRLFTAIGGRGAPRIDMIGNSMTAEIWLNEVNPIPGSLGYFLWEHATHPVTYPELLDALINEARTHHAHARRLTDPTAAKARMFQ